MNEFERTELPDYDPAEDQRVAQVMASPAGKRAFAEYHTQSADIAKKRGSLLSMSAENQALMNLATHLFVVPLNDFQSRKPHESDGANEPSSALILRQHEAFYQDLAAVDAHPGAKNVRGNANDVANDDDHPDDKQFTIMFSTAAQQLRENIQELGLRAQKRPPVDEEVRQQIAAVRGSIEFFQGALNWYNDKAADALSFADRARAEIEDSPHDNDALDHAHSTVASLSPAMELMMQDIMPEMNERLELIKANVNLYADDLAKGRNNVELLTGRHLGGGNVSELWER